MNWKTWVVFVGLLWICSASKGNNVGNDDDSCQELKKCLKEKSPHWVVADNFNGVIDAQKHWNQSSGCIVFLQKKEGKTGKCKDRVWLQMQIKDGATLLYISKWHINKKLLLYVLEGKNCSTEVSNLSISDSKCGFNHSGTEPCKISCVDTVAMCQSTYDRDICKNMDHPRAKNNKYLINITDNICFNCNNPVKEPEESFDSDDLAKFNITLETEDGEEVDAAQAAGMMAQMADIATSINGSSAAFAVGEGVTGILVVETEPMDEVSFAYMSPNDSLRIIESEDSLALFSRSVTVPKEAFEKAISLNISVPFAAVFRFTNLTTDAMNSNVLGNEVLAVEMGTSITNLTDKIAINFHNMKYEGIPSCHSWNGEGSRPNWTGDGCLTIKDGDNITCQCLHLTFFAILLAPLNETISSSDLYNLTVITQVGCGLSMFFLSIVLFMHFLLRKTKASKATRILIHLVSAMFLLNFSFLINNYVAEMKSTVGCKIMAALMHYFMLATFTWFAAQAFHLWLQLHMGDKIGIRRYVLKVSVTTWALPITVGIVLLIIGKYGEQVIHINDSVKNVTMCWITDMNVHYVVNIGYYVLVFLFTFTTFVIILSWLICLRRTKAGNEHINRSGKSIVAILGLCCMLGITWGFAFFAYGVLRIPAYYIFTALNSFQGFFLFVYYYYSSHLGEINGGKNGHNTSTTSTLQTSLDSCKNPYSESLG